MTGYAKVVLHPSPVIPMLIYKLFAIHIIVNFNNTFKRQNILKESGIQCIGCAMYRFLTLYPVRESLAMICVRNKNTYQHR